MPWTLRGSSIARTRQYVVTPWPWGPQPRLSLGARSNGEREVAEVKQLRMVAGEKAGSVEAWTS